MPISSDPNATAEFFLEVDRAKPPAKRPVFLVRFMTEAEHQRIAAMIEEAQSQPPTIEGNARVYSLLCQAIAIGVTGWRRMTGPDGQELTFDRERLEQLLGVNESGDWSLLTQRELWELACNYRFAVRLAGADRFLSASPEASAGESSAPAATPTAAAG